MINFTQLKGKTIAITGASRGIGKVTALLLGSLGANLALGARNELELKAAVSELESDVMAVALDVTQEQSIISFKEQAIKQFGKIDALINCAGTGMFTNILDLSTEDFDNMIAVNLRGTYLCCKHFGRHMVDNRSGQILNLVSIAGTTALSGCGGYSASKFGVQGFTKVLQTELRDKGVQVTAIIPGAVNTSFWQRFEQKPDLSLMIPVESLAEHIIYLLCQPKGCVVDEITIMPPLGIL